jgi:chromosome segregation ATPase
MDSLPHSHVCEENAYCFMVTGQLRSVPVRGLQNDDDLVALHEPFETALRGFNRRQVLEHLESLDGRIAIVAADRDAALAQVAELSESLNRLRSETELLVHLRREAEKSAAEVERILTKPMAQAGARIQRILQLAEEEAAELKARAQAEIAAVKAGADQDIAELRARADQDIDELRARADEQITALRASASREAKSLLEHAKRQCAQLESESAARRQAAEQASKQQIAQWESAANDRVRASELRSLAALHFMVRVMGAHLTERKAAIERDEAGLRERRAQVSTELTGLEAIRTEVTAAVVAAHQLLSEALGQVRKLAAQQPPGTRAEQAEAEVPSQRGAQDGAGYRMNAAVEERRSPRAPR